MIKKFFLTVVLSVIALQNYAYDFEISGIYYTILSSANMTVRVVTWDKSDENNEYSGYISIPDYVVNDGKTYYVTEIGSSAFSGCSKITAFNFTDCQHLTTIGNSAFSGCNDIHNITIPKCVTSIGNNAFSGCMTLTRVVIEDSETTLNLGYGSLKGNTGLFADAPLVYFYWGRPLSYTTSYKNSPISNQPSLNYIGIGPNVTTLTAYMYQGNTAITAIDLPKTVTTIGSHAFDGLTSLQKFTVPDHITTISDYAFANCTGLTEFTLSSKIKALGAGAFSGCTGLTAFTIPQNVTSIGNFAFNGCTGIKQLTLEEGEETLSLGYNNGSNTDAKGLFYDCPLESVFIGRNLDYSTSSYYGYSPFAQSETLPKARIGNSVKQILNNQFRDCKKLRTIEYESNSKPTSIGSYAFAGCTSLTEVTDLLASSITTIGEGAFMGCEKLYNVVIKPAVTSIGNFTFNGCTGLEQLTFEESDVVLSLGYNKGSNTDAKGMFYDCPLQSVFIGRNLDYSTSSYYGHSPFANIKTLIKARLGNPVKTIQAYLFSGCKAFTTLNYHSNCAPTSVGDYAFWGCTSLTEEMIKLPESIKTIGEGAFKECTSLAGYTIPAHIETVGNSAFMNCTKLANVIVKPSVKSIGNFAFNGCTSLSQLTFEEGDELLSLGYNNGSNTDAKGLFYDCPLESVFIGRNLDYSTSSYYGYSPFAYSKTLVKIRFGNPVTRIPSYVMYSCKALKQVAFNDKCKLESVGQYALSNCTLLALPSFPVTVTSFENYAFEKCIAFTTFDMPKSLKTIGNYTFSGCEGLTSVGIPSTVTSIGNAAFTKCTALTDVYCYAEKVPSTNEEAFLDTDIANATLHVPGPSISLYEAVVPWKNFKGMKATPDSFDPDAPQCATPTIAVENGKLVFSCETADVQFVADISSVDTQTHYASQVGLTGVYNVSVYATKSGYNKSETATMTVTMNLGEKGDVNGDGKVSITDAVSVVNIILNQGNTTPSASRTIDSIDEQSVHAIPE